MAFSRCCAHTVQPLVFVSPRSGRARLDLRPARARPYSATARFRGLFVVRAHVDGTAFVIIVLFFAAMVVAAVFNIFTRNAILATGLAFPANLALLYFFALRHDAFWPIAAFVFVPVVILACLAANVVAYGIRMATGKLDSEP